MTQSIFSSEPHRGWLPWAWLSPVVCILLVAFSSVPIDLGLESIGLVDAKGEPRSAFGFCVLLLLPFAAMGAAVWAWSHFVERRSLATLGLTGEQGLRKHLTGLAIGVGMIALAVVSIWLAGGYVSGDVLPALFSPESLFWIAVLLPCFAFQAGVEEFIFRGWLLSTATRRWNLAAGFIASSAAFTFLHFSPHQPVREIVMAFTFGLFACAWAWRAGSIWGVMGWHAGWNWFTGVGFAVPITGLDLQLPALVVQLTPTGPDALTGGPAGPESSVLTIGLLAAATLFLLLWPRGAPGSAQRPPANATNRPNAG
ncbi:MAG: type II CAAX endopeptidase family protein [Sphingopyxis sp.]|uniref:CPBP family intramembrane glutamic endopeptidase n=1 Tax=Sphingopyxis sp. TaxID=1908224 RepID=UPI002AB89C04|nr:type II CAAX endopeptidase family protein [Sphingopyxis sp.]MDZ3830353.1 type II CAAX endopeptidase family protein [Sphingopyxis sp.]